MPNVHLDFELVRRIKLNQNGFVTRPDSSRTYVPEHSQLCLPNRLLASTSTPFAPSATGSPAPSATAEGPSGWCVETRTVAWPSGLPGDAGATRSDGALRSASPAPRGWACASKRRDLGRRPRPGSLTGLEPLVGGGRTGIKRPSPPVASTPSSGS